MTQGNTLALVILLSTKAALCLLHHDILGLTGGAGLDFALGDRKATLISTFVVGVSMACAAYIRSPQAERTSSTSHIALACLVYQALVSRAQPASFSQLILFRHRHGGTHISAGVYVEGLCFCLVLAALLAIIAPPERARAVFDDSLTLCILGGVLTCAWGDILARRRRQLNRVSLEESVPLPIIWTGAIFAGVTEAATHWTNSHIPEANRTLRGLAIVVFGMFASKNINSRLSTAILLTCFAAGYLLGHTATNGTAQFQGYWVSVLSLWLLTATHLSPATILRRYLHELLQATDDALCYGLLRPETVRGLVADLECSSTLSRLCKEHPEYHALRHATETCDAEGHIESESTVALFTQLADVAFLHGDAYAAIHGVLGLAIRASTGAHLVVLRRASTELHRSGTHEAGLARHCYASGASTLEIHTSLPVPLSAAADIQILLQVQEASFVLYSATTRLRKAAILLHSFLLCQQQMTVSAGVAASLVRSVLLSFIPNHRLTGRRLALLDAAVGFVDIAQIDPELTQQQGECQLPQPTSFNIQDSLETVAHLLSPTIHTHTTGLVLRSGTPVSLFGSRHTFIYTLLRPLWDSTPDATGVMITTRPTPSESGLHISLQISVEASHSHLLPPPQSLAPLQEWFASLKVTEREKVNGSSPYVVRTIGVELGPAFHPAPSLSDTTEINQLALFGRLVHLRCGSDVDRFVVFAANSGRAVIIRKLLKTLTSIPVALFVSNTPNQAIVSNRSDVPTITTKELDAPTCTTVIVLDNSCAASSLNLLAGYHVVLVDTSKVLSPGGILSAFEVGM